jgi:hypothetical protein
MNWKNYFKNILVLGLLVLIILLLIQRSCFSPTPTTITDTIIKIEVRWDTVEIISEVYTPKWSYIVKPVFKYHPIDTLEILKDYFAQYYYKDTIHLDTLGFIIIKDTISQNKIQSRQTSSHLYIPTTTITKTININNREFYVGTGLGFDENQINYLGGELLYKNKKSQAYGLGIGVDSKFQPVISGKMYWKVGKHGR